MYTIRKLSNLNDLLGPTWYIRGLNENGDFCYVNSGTAQFYLQHLTGTTDSNGTLERTVFGSGHSLVFSFVHKDGTLPQWSTVIRQCE